MESLRVALLQLTSGENLVSNFGEICAQISSFRSHPDLVVLPENSLFFRIDSPGISEITLEDSIWKSLIGLSEDQNVDLLVTTPLSRVSSKVSQIRNAIVLVARGSAPRVVYEKIHLFDVDVHGQAPVRESDHFLAGEKPAVLDYRGWKIGLSICYDLRFSELYQLYARQEVDVIIVPSAFLVKTGEAHWEPLLRARAIESQAYVLAPAQGGEHRGEKLSRFTYGHSMAVSPWGVILGELKQDGPGNFAVECLRSEIEAVRKQIPMRQHRRIRADWTVQTL